MKLVIFITPDFEWELKPFKYLRDKFWPNQGITTVDFTTEGNNYSKALVNYAKSIKDDYFIKVDADHWLTDFADVKTINVVRKYMSKNKDIIRIQLGSWSGHENTTKRTLYNGIEFGECGEEKRDCVLTINMTPAIWNRKELIKLYEGEDWNMWQCETYASGKNQLRTMTINKDIYPYTHICSTRRKEVVLSEHPQGNELRQFVPRNFLKT